MSNGYISPSILVATPALKDPHFRRSVVLLVEHHGEGALGFVINRQGSLPLRDLLDLDHMNVPVELPAWFGGPVETESGIILSNSQMDTDSTEVARGVFLSSSKKSLETLIGSGDPRVDTGTPRAVRFPYRFLVGYAGWGPQQLDNEIAQGAWVQVAYDANLVFNTRDNELWDMALGGMGSHPGAFVTTAQSYLN